MVSLLDIGDATEEVTVRGKSLTITGVSAKGVLVLLDRFPEVRKLLTNFGKDVKAKDLLELAPEAIACVIACASGSPGNKKAEAVAASLGVGDQLEILEATLRLTFPQGLGPFVAKLDRLASSGNVPGASGWGAAMKSPEASNSSSEMVTHQQ
jgi:hypothetical protein